MIKLVSQTCSNNNKTCFRIPSIRVLLIKTFGPRIVYIETSNSKPFSRSFGRWSAFPPGVKRVGAPTKTKITDIRTFNL